jgi:hypothetical protein
MTIFIRRPKKDSDIEILNQISDLNDKVECMQKSLALLQRSLALLYQLLPDKIREGIIDGLNERNRKGWHSIS